MKNASESTNRYRLVISLFFASIKSTAKVMKIKRLFLITETVSINLSLFVRSSEFEKPKNMRQYATNISTK